MATQNIAYGTRNTITFSPASLGNGSYRESNEVDNSSNLYVDALVTGKLTTGTSPTNNGTVTVFVWGGDSTIRGGGNVTGADAALTPAGEDKQMRIAAVIVNDATSNHTYEFAFTVAQLFGGILPKKWGVVVLNSSGVALNATAGNHDLAYQGVTYTVA